MNRRSENTLNDVRNFVISAIFTATVIALPVIALSGKLVSLYFIFMMVATLAAIVMLGVLAIKMIIFQDEDWYIEKMLKEKENDVALARKWKATQKFYLETGRVIWGSEQIKAEDALEKACAAMHFNNERIQASVNGLQEVEDDWLKDALVVEIAMLRSNIPNLILEIWHCETSLVESRKAFLRSKPEESEDYYEEMVVILHDKSALATAFGVRSEDVPMVSAL